MAADAYLAFHPPFQSMSQETSENYWLITLNLLWRGRVSKILRMLTGREHDTARAYSENLLTT